MTPVEARLDEQASATSSIWRLLQSSPGSAAENMAVDEALLESAPERNEPVLRFYSWTERAASFGYFQKHADVERMTPLRPLPFAAGSSTNSIIVLNSPHVGHLPMKRGERRPHSWHS